MTYATARIHSEIAYLAHHLHWSLHELLDLEHADRRRFVAEVAELVTGPEGDR